MILDVDFAGRLWQIFRAIISGTLDELDIMPGGSAKTVMSAIDEQIKQFFVRSLQLDVFTMQLEYE